MSDGKRYLKLIGGPDRGTFKLVDAETGTDYSSSIISLTLTINDYQAIAVIEAPVIVDTTLSLDGITIDPHLYFKRG